MQRVKIKKIGISQDDRAAEERDTEYSKEILPSGDEEGTPTPNVSSFDKIKEKITKNALVIGLLIGGYVLLSENSTGGSGITVVK